MERLTKRYTYNGKPEISVDSKIYGISCSNFCTGCGKADCSDIQKALFKLAEYEDLEEQGKLLKLPCPVGDIVYTIYSNEYGSFIEESKVEEVSTHRVWIDSAYFDYDDFGRTVFLTREEAALEHQIPSQKQQCEECKCNSCSYKEDCCPDCEGSILGCEEYLEANGDR